MRQEAKSVLIANLSQWVVFEGNLVVGTSLNVEFRNSLLDAHRRLRYSETVHEIVN